MSEAPKFQSLADFIAFMADPENNGTGAPRTHFQLHVEDEPTHPGSAEVVRVVRIHPHGFAYLEQRFALHAEDGNKLLNHEQIAAFKTFKANEAAARREAAQQAKADEKAGVVHARIGEATGGAQ
jgi:hypothetical protein